MHKVSTNAHSKKKSSSKASAVGQNSQVNHAKVKTYQQKVKKGGNIKSTTKDKLDQHIETDVNLSKALEDSTRQIQIDIDLTKNQEVRISRESTICSKDSKNQNQGVDSNQASMVNQES